MVSAIRNIEIALGTSVKRRTASEIDNVEVARKSIIAARPIRVGECFSADNLTIKRPGTGISPMRWDEVLGRVRSEEHTSELQSLMRISYAVFCLKKKKTQKTCTTKQ